MSEASASTTARQRKILANSQKRLERLQRLKRSEAELGDTETLPDQFKDDNIEPNTQGECTEPSVFVESPKLASISKDSAQPDANTSNQNENTSEENIDKEQTIEHENIKQSETTEEVRPNLTTENTPDVSTPDVSTPIKEDELPLSWFYRKRRFIIFVLLSIISYCISNKGFHVYLSALLGKTWQQKDSFMRLYSAVELQMIIMTFLGKSEANGASLPVLLKVAINVSGMPKALVNLIFKIVGIISMAITDFSVYIFVYILLSHFEV